MDNETKKTSSFPDLDGKVIIKVQLGNDIRRIPIHNEEITYDELVLMMQRVFRGNINNNDDILIKYKDEDGDLITIFDSSDLAFAIQCSRILKITLFVNGRPGPMEGQQVQLVRRELRQLRERIDRLLESLESQELSGSRQRRGSTDSSPPSTPATKRSEPAGDHLLRAPLLAAAPSEFDPIQRAAEPPSAAAGPTGAQPNGAGDVGNYTASGEQPVVQQPQPLQPPADQQPAEQQQQQQQYQQQAEQYQPPADQYQPQQQQQQQPAVSAADPQGYMAQPPQSQYGGAPTTPVSQQSTGGESEQYQHHQQHHQHQQQHHQQAQQQALQHQYPGGYLSAGAQQLIQQQRLPTAITPVGMGAAIIQTPAHAVGPYPGADLTNVGPRPHHPAGAGAAHQYPAYSGVHGGGGSGAAPASSAASHHPQTAGVGGAFPRAGSPNPYSRGPAAGGYARPGAGYGYPGQQQQKPGQQQQQQRGGMGAHQQQQRAGMQQQQRGPQQQQRR
ncbi:protein TFG-like isoform X1 [Amphibalanus amphitrite]|uniref:protein TFG-like isoform X1 n=1 Tax=Amphibalanus amphitrite TaxID=1232801 RepID=UPI001C922A64|nr:protein TFG-like isoform X1 [Amphibalanus amphitrite]XP_043204522.1 protein TFG-like isoform X1 [Amphibalanus amphitrite]XP_043204531.1 protein TFG-like isoform X1 [Amphibalanus amphitrite]XP_043204540.1 protein TFG-like isoform X1 [Amphibalanus amphitrite]